MLGKVGGAPLRPCLPTLGTRKQTETYYVEAVVLDLYI